MAIFQPIVITNAGLNLLSQAVAGQGTLTFTSIATSSTVIAYNPTTIQGMTSLSGIVQTTVPARALLQDGTAQVSAVFDNSGLSQGYTANTLGLYATLGSGAQTLFAVAVASTPDNIPAPSSLPASSFYYQFNIAISDTSQLTIGIPDGGSLPSSVFNQMFPGIVAPDQDNDGDALVYNASSGAWGYVDTENALTTVSGSGEAVSLQKTLAGNFDQIQIFGKATQNKINGYQLFDSSKVPTLSQNGATVTNNNDGSFTISGSGNLPSDYWDTYDLSPSETAALLTLGSINLSGISATRPNFIVQIRNASQVYTSLTPTNSSGEITQEMLGDPGLFIRVGFFGSSGMPIVSGSVKPMLYQSGDGNWEPYTGKIASPSPQLPAQITGVGNYNSVSTKYDIPVFITGVQLFDSDTVSSLSQNGATVTNNNDGSFTISGDGNLSNDYWNVHDLTPAETHGILSVGSINLSGISATRPNFIVQIRNASQVYIELNPSNLQGTVTQQMVDDAGLFMRVGFFGSSGLPVTPGNVKPMLYQSGDGSWVPYQQIQETIPLEAPLYGLPMDTISNYIDSDNQHWNSNILALQSNNQIEAVKFSTFNGSENWLAFDNSSNYPCYYLYLSDMLSGRNLPGMCTHFNTQPSPTGATTNGITFGIGDKSIYITLADTTYNTAQLFKNWLQDNPISVLYPLANPTATPLTPDQVSALEALQTFNPNTNIFSGTYPAAGLSVTAQGFNIAGDLAQNMMALQGTVQSQADEIETLQGTVQSQGAAIAANTTKLSTFGLVGYGTQSGPETGQTISMASFVPNWSDVFTSGALYSVFFSVTFSVSSSGGVAFQPYIMQSIRTGLSTSVTQLPLPPVYQANTGNTIPYTCNFMIETDADQDVADLEFQVDTGSHDFTNAVAAIYRVR